MAAPVPLTFADSERSTVGLEWELALVDTDSGELRQAATAVLDAVEKRYIVQVGAFADAGAASEARARAEKVGVRTYTQVIETDAGRRIRVRVGPFNSREEADKAAAALKKSGLPAAIQSL